MKIKIHWSSSYEDNDYMKIHAIDDAFKSLGFETKVKIAAGMEPDSAEIDVTNPNDKPITVEVNNERLKPNT